MRWPVRAAAPGRRLAGFTLVELLVVLVILGSLLSLAMLSVGGFGHARELRNEAQRLAALIGLLSEEAVLENREYGLLIRDKGYRVLVFDELESRWDPLDGEKEHALPVWARLELELDGEPLKLAAPAGQGDDEAGLDSDDEDTRAPRRKRAAGLPEPQLLVLSSGELSPFRLQVAEREPGGSVYELSSDGFQLPRAELLEERR